MKRILSMMVCLVLVLSMVAVAGCKKEETSTVVEDFKKGIWVYANEDGINEYYCFYGDGKGGSTLNMELGIGLAFEYTINDDSAVFCFGSPDFPENCVLTQADENTICVQWENSGVGVLSYLSDDTFDTFNFYSNEELRTMAHRWYEEFSGTTISNEDFTVDTDNLSAYEVKLDILASGEENAEVLASLTVNRMDGTGTDAVSGEKVELLTFAQ